MLHASRLQSWQVATFLIALTAGIALTAWFCTRPGQGPVPLSEEIPGPDPIPPDPRLVFDTPFRNVKPGVGYVGDDACSQCHLSITKSYHAHPMGQSAEFVAKASPLEKYDPSAHTTFSSGPFDLKVNKSAEGVLHRVHFRDPMTVPLSDVVIPAKVVIGSGTRGRSYLSVEDGSVWQTPISWFGPDQRWDLSPGFQLGTTVRRPIVAACLYCHVDRVEPIAGTENRYREPLFPKQAAIGCERCHGPGALHVSERTRGDVQTETDTSIVNPRHLSPPLQHAICEQCHLQGENRVNRRGRDPFEFRPGLPFEQFVSVYVRHPEIATANKSVGQFEQMEQSRCFTASGGRLLCTSCHDPHSALETAARDAHYKKRCLTCHDSKGCTLSVVERQVKNDSCIACHMPKAASSNITHASVTDHRVLRKPGDTPAVRGLPFGTLPIVRFRNGPLSPSASECERDLALALARFAKKSMPKELEGRGDFRLLAIERLKKSLTRWPGDADAWSTLANACAGRNEAAEKFKAATQAASLTPESISALSELVEAAIAADDFDAAEKAAGKCIQLNPSDFHPLVSRAFTYLSRGDWSKAEADCVAALRIQPFYPAAHLYYAVCLHKKGDPAAGLREMQAAARLESDPRARAYMEGWYSRATR